MSNRLNAVYAKVHGGAKHIASQNSLRRDKIRILNEIEAIEDELSQLSEDVTEERGTYNTWAKAGGCVVGGILGSGGGVAGVVSGCKLGSELTGLAADYAYDGSIIQTQLEDELLAKKKELEDYEIELDALSTRFPQYQAVEWVEDRESRLDKSLEDFEKWQDGFYGKEDVDYLMDLVNVGITYAGTKVGETVLNNLWDQTFDTDFSKTITGEGTDPGVINPTSSYDPYSFPLPDYSDPYDMSNIWQEYLRENYQMQGGY